MDRGNEHLRYGLLALAVLLSAVGLAGEYVLKDQSPFNNPTGGFIHYTGTTLPYIDLSGGYGRSYTNDPNFVQCEGAFTTKWEWVPNQIPDPANPGEEKDDPLDPIPAFVIVRETCEASYAGSYYIPGGSASDLACDNGLGFEADEPPPVPIFIWDPINGWTIIGYFVEGVSEGTLYTKIAGTQTIEITRNPLAEVHVVGGLCEASVLYSSQIIIPTVEPVGTTEFPNLIAPNASRAIKFITGQQITGEVKIDGGPPSLGPLQIDPSSYQWGFESSSEEAVDIDVFKDYTHSSANWNSVGERTDLTAADKDNIDFKFYTNRKGKTKVVCNFEFIVPEGAVFAGGVTAFQARSKEIESVRPTYVDWDVIDGEVRLFSDGFAFVDDPNKQYSTDGQTWRNVDYDLPLGFATTSSNKHTGSFCQLINADRFLERTLQPFTPPGTHTEFEKYPWNATQAVDMGLPYFYGDVWDPSTVMGFGVDSPKQPLYVEYIMAPPFNAPYFYPPLTLLWIKSTALDTFETFALYKPPKVGSQGTVWIPMAKYTWRWQGTAEWTYTLGQWQWVLSGTSPSGLYGPQPYAIFDHPAWQKMSPSPFSWYPFTWIP